MGAPQAYSGGDGYACIYTNNNGSWNETHRFNNPTNTSGGFGIYVDICGDNMVIATSRFGSAKKERYFLYTKGSDGNWKQKAELMLSEKFGDSYLNGKVSISDKYVLIKGVHVAEANKSDAVFLFEIN